MIRKPIISLCILLFCSIFSIYASGDSQFKKNILNLAYRTALDKGLSEFKKPYEKQDYSEAIKQLRRAIKIDSNSAQAYYFLGNAIDKLNAKDANLLIKREESLTNQASQALQKCIALSPKYEKDILYLDPYTKLSSIWASQAMAFLYQNKKEKAIKTLYQGKKAGAFDDRLIEWGKNLLKQVPTKAILFVSGDQISFLLFYIQIFLNYRADIGVIDIHLLNAPWYLDYLIKQSVIQLSKKAIDYAHIDTAPWQDSLFSVTIHNTDHAFSWYPVPGFNKKEFIRSELMTLEILKANAFQRPICYALGVDIHTQPIPHTAIEKRGLYSYLNPYFKEEYSNLFFKHISSYKTSKLNASRPIHSIDLLGLLNTYRILHLQATIECIREEEDKKAKKIIKQMIKKYKEDKLPYIDEKLKEQVYMHKQLLNIK